jgi:hypothetical protein
LAAVVGPGVAKELVQDPAVAARNRRVGYAIADAVLGEPSGLDPEVARVRFFSFIPAGYDRP